MMPKATGDINEQYDKQKVVIREYQVDLRHHCGDQINKQSTVVEREPSCSIVLNLAVIVLNAPMVIHCSIFPSLYTLHDHAE